MTIAEELAAVLANIARETVRASTLLQSLERENADLNRQLAHLQARPLPVQAPCKCDCLICALRKGLEARPTEPTAPPAPPPPKP